MVVLHWDREYLKQISKQRVVRYGILFTTGLLLFLFFIEGGLNFWIRSGIRRRLTATAQENQIETKVSWVGLGDLISGRVNQIWINSRNCVLNDLRYSKLIIDSRGFWFDLPVLLKENRLELLKMDETKIDGVIDEQALNDYLDLRYPQYQSTLRLKPGKLIISGSARVLNKIIPVKLEGNFKAISQKQLRFYPSRLLIANTNISGSLLRIVSEQVPFEFEILKGWPLKITHFKLEEKKIKIIMEESKT